MTEAEKLPKVIFVNLNRPPAADAMNAPRMTPEVEYGRGVGEYGGFECGCIRSLPVSPFCNIDAEEAGDLRAPKCKC